MKLAEIKQQVYAIGEVNSTQALKQKFKELHSLDMRLKLSWLKALDFIKGKFGLINTESLQREAEIAQERWQHEDEKFDHLNKKLKEAIGELQHMKQDENLLQEECEESLKEGDTHLNKLVQRSEARRRANLN